MHGDDSDGEIDGSALLKTLQPLYKDVSSHACFHIITQDNWFNSWTVAKAMHKRKIYCRGTIRSGRSVPTIHKTNKHNRVGTERHIYYYDGQNGGATTGIGQETENNNGMYAVITSIRDSSSVCFITTVPGETGAARCTTEPKPGRVARNYPLVVTTYRKNYGAVDGFDRLRAIYTCHQGTDRYWKSIWFWALDSMAINSFFLAKLDGAPFTDSYKTYLLRLIHNLYFH